MLVISAVSIRKAGPLTVLKSVVKELSIYNGDMIVFVGDDTVLEETENCKQIVVGWARKSWFHRLYFEYVWCYKWSKIRAIDTWLSLHDITTNVVAKKRIVYCHNPMPFTKPKISYLRDDPKQLLFAILYKIVYRINVNKNDLLIVQQKWLALEFSRFYKNKIVIIPPFMMEDNALKKTNLKLIYPAFPRAAKNHQYLIDMMMKESGLENVEIIFTFSGHENRLAEKLKDRVQSTANIKLIGWQSKKELADIVRDSDGIVFPSLAETWGLPLVEFYSSEKFTFVADLPYAYETCSGLRNVYFFNAHVPSSLAGQLRHLLVEKDTGFERSKRISDILE